MKHGYKSAIEKEALANKDFRRVMYTATHCQIVLMSLAPLEEIGLETHTGGDQFFRFESGSGRVLVDNSEYLVMSGDAIIVPMGSTHNVINTSATEPLKLYTIYAPPHHRDATVHVLKADALADNERYDGKVTEWRVS